MGQPTCESSLLGGPDATFFGEKLPASKNPLSTRRLECISQTQASPEVGAGEGTQAPPLPLRPYPGFKCKTIKHKFKGSNFDAAIHLSKAEFLSKKWGPVTCTMRTVRTRRGVLKSYLGTRTQTPSSSPDPFSCYKMQRRLNEKLQCVPNFLSHSGGSPQT